MIARIITILVLLVVLPVQAASLAYEIHKINKDGTVTLLVKGVKKYKAEDVEVVTRSTRGGLRWQKSILLAKGLGIGVSIYREAKPRGFGMWAKGSPCGFSWEWFRPIKAGKYLKLQEIGVISVKYRKYGGKQEIAEISFDTDISFRLNEERKAGVVTHRILIRKGSVFVLPEGSMLQIQKPSARSC